MWYKILDDIVDYRHSINKNLTPDEIFYSTVSNIMENYPSPYHLMCSGGIDSQAMLLCWKKYGKNFIPVAVTYSDNLNDYDLENLKILSEKENIEINYLNFDVHAFYDHDYDHFANEFLCTSPQIAVHIGMTRNLGGTVIFGGNLLSAIELYTDIQHVYTKESLRRPLIRSFLSSSPEIAYSGLYMFNDKHLKDIGITPLSYKYKVLQYQNLGLNVIPQKNRNSGFDKVKDVYDVKLKDLHTAKHKLKYSTKFHSRRLHDQILRYPYEEKFGKKQWKTLLNEDVSNTYEYRFYKQQSI